MGNTFWLIVHVVVLVFGALKGLGGAAVPKRDSADLSRPPELLFAAQVVRTGARFGDAGGLGGQARSCLLLSRNASLKAGGVFIVLANEQAPKIDIELACLTRGFQPY
jgi:hypothetical protein